MRFLAITLRGLCISVLQLALQNDVLLIMELRLQSTNFKSNVFNYYFKKYILEIYDLKMKIAFSLLFAFSALVEQGC